MQGQVKVTPARWWHVPGLSRLIRDSRRERGERGAIVWAQSWSPSLGLLQSVWSAPVPRAPRSLVAEQDRRPVGLAQMRPRREPRNWDVVFLAVESARPPVTAGVVHPTSLGLAPDRRATRLLGELCDVGVELGAERLSARIREDGGRFEVFKQLGFSPVVREYTYFQPLAAAARHGRLAAPAGMRPQGRADAFGLAQLYQACTPKVVQMAEGKRSDTWDAQPGDLRWPLDRRPRLKRWVVERDGRKVGWLQVRNGRRRPHVLRIMVDESARDLNQALLDFALEYAAKHQATGAAIRVREHQETLTTVLEASGFYLVDDSLLMVKQLAVPVPAPQRHFAPALEKAV
jgi:hypothetical protein